MSAEPAPHVLRANLALNHVCGAPASVAILRLRLGALEVDATLNLDGTVTCPRGITITDGERYAVEQAAQTEAMRLLVDTWAERRQITTAAASRKRG